MLKLTDILKHIGKRVSTMGDVYYGTVVTNSVAAKTSVIVNKLTLPAGVYVISANIQFAISTSAGTVVNIYQTGVGTLAIERGDMAGGGGHSLIAIANFANDAEVVCNVYQAHTAAVNVTTNRLMAVRMK